jgi:hypothetical protein
MEEFVNKLIALILVSAFLTSCTPQPVEEPPVIPAITNTVGPTSTTPPKPTDTAVPTEEVTLPDLGSFSTLVVVEGFTISVPFPLLHQVNKNVVIIGDEANTLTISFASDEYQSGDTPERVMSDYLGSLERRGWEFTKGEPADIEVDGATGIIIDLTGTFQGLNFEGQAVTVPPYSDLALFGLGLSQVSADPNRWKDSGQKAFTTLLESIEFVDAGGECPVSTDDTYGYSEDNPIRVGGEFVTGVSRERAYLDHLRGPNGESLSYERQGSLPYGDTILDIYNVTGPGVDEILYVDLYNYSELQAPVGFTCEGPFPLFAP